MEFAGQSVLVLGLGLSGRSAARFCAERGARVVAIDERDADSIPAAADLPKSIDCRFGEPFPESFDYDVVVPSPGIPADRWAGRARRVWGDIELAYRALPIPIIAVTGTNGKSTVVRLIEAMARASGLRARAAGNVGVPALDLVIEHSGLERFRSSRRVKRCRDTSWRIPEPCRSDRSDLLRRRGRDQGLVERVRSRR